MICLSIAAAPPQDCLSEIRIALLIVTASTNSGGVQSARLVERQTCVRVRDLTHGDTIGFARPQGGKLCLDFPSPGFNPAAALALWAPKIGLEGRPPGYDEIGLFGEDAGS